MSSADKCHVFQCFNLSCQRYLPDLIYRALFIGRSDFQVPPVKRPGNAMGYFRMMIAEGAASTRQPNSEASLRLLEQSQLDSFTPSLSPVTQLQQDSFTRVTANWAPLRSSTTVSHFATKQGIGSVKENIAHREAIRRLTLLDAIKRRPQRKHQRTRLTTGQLLERHPLLPPCRCRMLCAERIDPETRQGIHKMFWSLTWEGRQSFLDKYVEYTHCAPDSKHKRPRQNIIHRKQRGKFHLPNDDGDKEKVCQRMFLRTLGSRTDALLCGFRRGHSNGHSVPMCDTRGQRFGPSAVKQSIVGHIASFHPAQPHYTRAHAPLRRYLDRALSIHKMWIDYNSKFPHISYESYQKVFHQSRITFGFPKQDLCDVCEEGKMHKDAPHDMPKAECPSCVRLALHETFAAIARKAYQDDAMSAPEGGTEYYAVDMQKVLLLPILTAKSCFFVSRLVCFNETFARMGKGLSHALLWHEAISSRRAADLASTYYALIVKRSPEIKNFVFWSDNCCAQNKNWTLFSSFHQVVNSPAGPNSITMKYLERGHTYLRADSIHAAIAKTLKRHRRVEDFSRLVQLIQVSQRNLVVQEIGIEGFLQWVPFQSPNSKQWPKLHNLQSVRFIRGDSHMYYKKRLDSPFSRVVFGSIETMPALPPCQAALRGINAEKKREICRHLIPLIAAQHRDFWHSLPARNVEDLVSRQI